MHPETMEVGEDFPIPAPILSSPLLIFYLVVWAFVGGEVEVGIVEKVGWEVLKSNYCMRSKQNHLMISAEPALSPHPSPRLSATGSGACPALSCAVRRSTSLTHLGFSLNSQFLYAERYIL